jgi:hypothetical protein
MSARPQQLDPSKQLLTHERCPDRSAGSCSGGETAVSAADTPPAKQPPDSHSYLFFYLQPGGEHDSIGSWSPPRLDQSADGIVLGALCTPTTPPRPNTGGRSSPPAGSQSTSRTRAERRALSAPSTASGKSTASDQFATVAGMLRSGWLRTDVLPRVYREESRSVAVCWKSDIPCASCRLLGDRLPLALHVGAFTGVRIGPTLRGGRAVHESRLPNARPGCARPGAADRNVA